MSLTDAYGTYLGNLGGSRQQTSDLFGELLSGSRQSRQDTADRYAMMRQQLSDMSSTASGQTQAGYGAARNRVQAAPRVYRGPVGPGPQAAAVPSVGMDAGTAANLQSAAGQFGQSNQAALQQVYDMLGQSEAANMASRLSDIDIAQTSDLAQLAALAQAQQFGLGAAESGEMSALDALINQTLRDQIATDLGFDQQTLAAITGMTQAERDAQTFAFDVEQAAADAERADQAFDQNALNSSVSMFTAMIDPIVDSLDPQSVIELWLAFAGEIGMPMDQALGSVGAV
jgi:hypothetical protein